MKSDLDGAIERDLRMLTSPRASGRLPGSEGARAVGEYLAAELEKAGATPVGGRWLHPVTVKQTVLVREPSLVVDGNPLRHRWDYSTRPDLGGNGPARGMLVVAEDEPDADPSGAVLLIDRSLDAAALARMGADAGIAAVITVDRQGRMPRKVVYGELRGVPAVAVTPERYERLRERAGALVELESESRRESVLCHNVVGVAGPEDADATVLLVAHYDHVGDDPGGTRFPGAFDNASGVAVVLGAARAVGARGLRTRIAFAFTTGEESGLWGAKELLDSGILGTIAAAINVDGIGSEALTALRVGSDGRRLRDLVEPALRSRGIEARNVGGRDDSLALEAAGVPTIGLGQEPVRRPLSFLHTTEDRTNRLEKAAIRDCTELVTSLVLDLENGTNGRTS